MLRKRIFENTMVASAWMHVRAQVRLRDATGTPFKLKQKGNMCEHSGARVWPGTIKRASCKMQLTRVSCKMQLSKVSCKMQLSKVSCGMQLSRLVAGCNFQRIFNVG
jgi:hypothetical protein